MIKAIIFDFFGVFTPDISFAWFQKYVSTAPHEIAKLQAICDLSDHGELNKSSFYDALAAISGIHKNNVIAGVEAEIHIDQELVAVVKVMRRNNIRIACLSNGSHEWALDIMKRYGLTTLFDHVILSADVHMAKPDREIYAYTLKQLNVSAHEAFFTDDRVKNTKAAERFGIKSHAFTTTEKFLQACRELDIPTR